MFGGQSPYVQNRIVWAVLLTPLTLFTVWSFLSPSAKDFFMVRGWAGARLALDSPKDGATIASQAVTLKGKAQSPQIRIVVNSKDITPDPIEVSWDGSWSATVPSRELIGDVRLVQSSEQRFKGESIAVRFLITAPAAREEVADPEMQAQLRNRVVVTSHLQKAKVFSGIIRFEGTARPGARITGFRGRNRISTVTADAEGRWTIETIVREADEGQRFKFEDTDLPQHFAAIRLEVL